MANVQIIIEAVDKARGALDGVTRQLAQMEGANKKLDAAQKQVAGSSNQASAGFNFMAGAIRGAALQLTAFFSAAKFIEYISSAVRGAEATKNFAEEVGLTVEQVSKLRFAFAQSGVGSAEFEQGIRHLNQQMAESAKASSTAAATFRALGIGGREGNASLLQTNDVVRAVAEKFQTYEAGANKSRIAQELFGRGATRMALALNDGTEGLDALGKKLEEVGGVVTPDAADAANKLSNELGLADEKIQGMARDLGTQLIPTILEAIEAFNSYKGASEDFRIIFEGVLGVIKVFISGIIVIVGMLRQVATIIGTLSVAVGEAVVGNFAVARDLIKGIFDEVKANADADAEKIENLFAIAKRGREELANTPAGSTPHGSNNSATRAAQGSARSARQKNRHPPVDDLASILEKATTIIEARNAAEQEYQRLILATDAKVKLGQITQTKADEIKIEGAKKLNAEIEKTLVNLEKLSTDNPSVTQLKTQIEALKTESLKSKIEASQAAPGNFHQSLLDFSNSLTGIADKTRLVAATISGILRPAIDGLSSGIVDVINGTKSWGQAFVQIADQILASLIKITVEMLVQNTLRQALGVTSFSLLGLFTGGLFDGGGYTGIGNPGKPAGIVHKDEVVIPSPVVQKYGAAHFLAYLNPNFPGYEAGGIVTSPLASSSFNSPSFAGATTFAPTVNPADVHVVVLNDPKHVLNVLESKPGQKVIFNTVNGQKLNLGILS